MKKVEKIKEELGYGDYQRISEIATPPGKKPISIYTITSIFTGRRNADTKTGRRIIEAAEKLVASRKALRPSLEPQPEVDSKPVARKAKKVPNQIDLF